VLEEWVLALAASPVVYAALYLVATIDGFFPPVPSESAVIALAAMAVATGVPDLWLVLAVAAAGAFTGDQIAYAIGRRVSVRRSPLLRRPRAQRTLDWAEEALATRGASFIIGARYIPVGRVAVNMTAGAVGFPRRRFVGLTALAAVSWAVYSTAIGIGAGAWLHDRPLVAVAVGVVAGTLIGLGVDAVLSRVQRRPRVRHLGATTVPEPVLTHDVLPDDVVPQGALPDDVVPQGVLPDDLLADDVLREGVLPDGDLPEDLLEEDLRGGAVRDAGSDVEGPGRGRREPEPAALLPGEHP
jgi:membrane-associated protein